MQDSLVLNEHLYELFSLCAEFAFR